MQLENMSDEELLRTIAKAPDNADDIVEYLLKKYKYLVRRKANTMFLVGGDTDDLVQEGMIGLLKAIRDYREEAGTSFQYFADMCISRQIYTAIESAQRQKNAPLNSYISLNGDDSEDKWLISANDNSYGDPLYRMIREEKNRQMIAEAGKKLSAMELEVFRSYLLGMDIKSIAGKMNKPYKAIDNALQRIRSKLT